MTIMEANTSSTGNGKLRDNNERLDSRDRIGNNLAYVGTQYLSINYHSRLSTDARKKKYIIKYDFTKCV